MTIGSRRRDGSIEEGGICYRIRRSLSFWLFSSYYLIVIKYYLPLPLALELEKNGEKRRTEKMDSPFNSINYCRPQPQTKRCADNTLTLSIK